MASDLGAAVAVAGVSDSAGAAIITSNDSVSRSSMATTGKPAMCLVLSSVQKRANIGFCVRSAVAMGCSSLIVTGASKTRTDGAQRTEKYIDLRHFPKLPEAVAWLKGRGFNICGIEITPAAVPVQSHPFRGPTAFIAGNEGSGLPREHQALCDHFVYIPQFSQGTASLNVAIATSIVLHHFATWAGYTEAPRDPSAPEKFLVSLPPQKRGATTELDLERQRARKERRETQLAAGSMPACIAEPAPVGDFSDGGGEVEGEPGEEDDV